MKPRPFISKERKVSSYTEIDPIPGTCSVPGNRKNEGPYSERNTANSLEFVNIIRQRIFRNFQRRMRKIGKILGMARRSVVRVVNQKLKMTSYCTRKMVILSLRKLEMRLKKLKWLLAPSHSVEHLMTVFSEGG